MEELRAGGSWGVHSWIEGASGDGRRVSWFVPQNQVGGQRLKMPSCGGLAAGEEVTSVGRCLGPSGGRGGNGVQGHGVEVGIFPRMEFWRFSQNRPSTWVSRTLRNREPDLHRHDGITEKASTRRKNLDRQMSPCIFSYFAPTGILVFFSFTGSLVFRVESCWG